MISLRALSSPSGLCDELDCDIINKLHAFVTVASFLIEEFEEHEERKKEHIEVSWRV